MSIRDFKSIKPSGNGNIPIVGQAIEAFECVPIVTARCKCHEDNKPFIIRGVEMAMTCNQCRNVYGITYIQFDRHRNVALGAQVSVIGRAGVAEPQDPAAEPKPEPEPQKVM